MVLLLLVPVLVPNPYYLRLIQIGMIFGIIALGLDLLVGHAGLISLASNSKAENTPSPGWP